MKKQLILQCEEVLNKLYKFSDNLLFLGVPITDRRLNEFEKQIGFPMPLDFKHILTRHNSLSLFGTEVLGIGEQFKGNSLDKVYIFEHGEQENPLFEGFLPFSPDGRGNYYCLDLSRLENDSCPVVFWQHDFFYSDKNAVETCNSNFIDWIEEVLIEWNSEDITNREGRKSEE